MDNKSEWLRPAVIQFGGPQQALTYIRLNATREQIHKLAPFLSHVEAHEPGRERDGRRTMPRSPAAPAPPSAPLVETPGAPFLAANRNPAGSSNPVVFNEGDVVSSIGLLQRVTNSLERAGPNPADGTEPGQAAVRLASADQAKEELRRRRQRFRLFGRAMFGEPAWDVLLILYIEHEQVGLTFSRVAEESGAPATTFRRWLDYLESQRLVRRIAHPTDRRATCIELTDKAACALDSYFS